MMSEKDLVFVFYYSVYIVFVPLCVSSSVCVHSDGRGEGAGKDLGHKVPQVDLLPFFKP